MKPPISELKKVIEFYEHEEKRYGVKMDVTKPMLKSILVQFNNIIKYKNYE